MDKDKPIPKEWLDWFLTPPINYREIYGEPLEFDPLDRYYQKIYEAKLKEKPNAD